MHALITGANRGIGAELTEQMRAKGIEVTPTSRTAQDGFQTLDVTNPDSHIALAQRLNGTPIDLLICNAGVYHDKGQALETGFAAQDWAATFAANVTGVFLTIQALLPNLKAANAPKIAIIGSKMGSQARAPGGSYIYRASKAAVLNLGRNLASDLKSDNIAVGVYHPGWVITDMGGQEVDITKDISAQGLIQEFETLSMATTGSFRAFDGETLPF